MNPQYSFVDNDFLAQSEKIKTLGGGTFGSVNLYETPKGQLAVKETKLSNKSLGYPPDLLAELDMLIKLQSLENVVQLKGASFDVRAKKGFLLLEPCDMNVTSWARKNNFSRRIKYLPRLISGIGSVLSIMHRFSLIHNDIKSNNILVKETENGPIFKLADFGKSGYIISSDGPYGGIAKYRPPFHRNLFFSEYWAFMVCLVEYILGDKRMVNTEDTSIFYRRYLSRNSFNLQNLLKYRLGKQAYDKIPHIFWFFVGPIINDQNVPINNSLNNIGFRVPQTQIDEVNQTISQSDPSHKKLSIILDEFKRKFKKLHRENYFPRFKSLINKFLINVPDSEKFNNATLLYYAEVAFIIIVKGKVSSYEYFRNQKQFLEFQRAFLVTVKFQTLII